MSDQDPRMDALDQRLVAYLGGRAEMAAAFGPGPDQVAASISAGMGRVALPGRRAGTGLLGIPALAWALLAIGALAAMALALAAGSDRDDGLVLLPPASTASALRGEWVLDFQGSGIDPTYGGPGADQLRGPDTFGSVLWFGPGEAMRVWTGAAGGCETDGTWQAAGNQVTIMLPTGQNGCELTGPGREARKIRERLAAATTFTLDGATLTFLASDGSPSIVYEQGVDEAGNPVPRLWDLGELELDFAASGIDPTIASGGVASQVTSSIAFDDIDGLRVVTAIGGVPCDDEAGTYDDYLRLAIQVPTLSGRCGDGPLHPDLQVRRQLARVAWYEVTPDGAVRLTEDSGNALLVYRPGRVSPDGSVQASPAVGEPVSIEGAWWLDFEASGIDDSYVRDGAPQNGWRFSSGIAFEPGGRFRVASGAGGGCEAAGRWQVVGGRLTVDVPTGVDGCESSGPGPAALEIRQRVARAEQVVLRGTRLTLLDASGDRLLVFDRSTNGALWGQARRDYERRWQLDFEASGIQGYYMLTSGPKRSKVPVASSIEFADGVVSGGTGAGGGCDSFEGAYSDADGRFSIDLPAAVGHCGPGPVYPDLEVRQHLERTAALEVDGDVLRLLDEDGTLLLLYRLHATETP